MRIVLLSAFAALTACAPSAGGEPHSTPLCTPAPLPSPQVLLVSPGPNATGVATTTASIEISTYGLVTAMTISPAIGGATALTGVAAVGSASPAGMQTYAGSPPGMLAAGTTYTIAANVTLDAGNCPQTFLVTAGSFST